MRSLQDIREHLEDIRVIEDVSNLSIQESIYQRYCATVKAELIKIMNENTPPHDLIQALDAYLTKNWKRVKGTSLCYTAIPEREITLLLCDIAEYMSAEGNLKNSAELPRVPIEFLMPDIYLHSATEDYPSFGDIIKAIKFNEDEVREYNELLAWEARLRNNLRNKTMTNEGLKRLERFKSLEELKQNFDQQQKLLKEGLLIQCKDDDYLRRAAALQRILNTHILNADQSGGHFRGYLEKTLYRLRK